MKDKEKEEKYSNSLIDVFVKYMRKLLNKKHLKKRDVFYLADIPVNYGYKLLLGEKRTKQRDIIIRICLVSTFSIRETQEALRLYEMPILYKKFKRDGLILEGIQKGIKEVDMLNEILERNNVSRLKTCGKN